MIIDTAKRKTQRGFYLIRFIGNDNQMKTIKPVFAESKAESRLIGREITKELNGKQFLITLKLKKHQTMRDMP